MAISQVPFIYYGSKRGSEMPISVLKVSKSFQKCPKVSKSVQKCPKVSKSFQKCPKVSKSVLQRPKASKSVQKRPKDFNIVHNGQKGSINVQNCTQVSNKCPKVRLRNIWMAPQKIQMTQRTRACPAEGPSAGGARKPVEALSSVPKAMKRLTGDALQSNEAE